MSSLFSHDWITLAEPAYLALLLLVPVCVYLGYRALAPLGPVRRIMAITLRAVLLILIVLALADLEHVRRVDDQTAVFILDTSSSVAPELQDYAFDYIRRAAESMRPDKDRIALVTCSGDARVEQFARENLMINHYNVAPRPNETNLAAGLRLAAALLPPDTAQRVVLISDGNANAGDTRTEAERLQAAGVPVDVLPLTYNHHNEVIFERIIAPNKAHADDRVNLGFVIRATHATHGKIAVYLNEQPLDLDATSPGVEFPVELHAGLNRLTLPVSLHYSGLNRFRAVFTRAGPADDYIPQNNVAVAHTIVGGRERVLVVGDFSVSSGDSEQQSANTLASALKLADVDCTVQSVDQADFDPAALMPFSAVILSNVSAIALGEDQQRALASYVHDLGGGLVTVGGDRSFSVGGYYQTPLEDILPVVTDKQKLQLLSLSLIVVMDQSGSMSGEKIALAKKAAEGAVDFLGPTDRIGIITFSDMPLWVLPLTPAENKALIRQRIDRIFSGGGTNMYPALREAANALRSADTNIRHVILLTDGQSMPGDFEGIAHSMAAESITISAVAIGPDANVELMEQLAGWTGGRAYVTPDASSLPKIFIRETILAGRSGVKRERFQPTLRTETASPLVSGLRQDAIPPLAAYVVTSARPLATVPLIHASDEGVDPILAHWQVGLGRSVAFTSGMWPLWGTEWATWPGFPKFWSQTVRWAARPAESDDFDVQVHVDGEKATVTLDAADPGQWIHGGFQIVGNAVHPEHGKQTVEFRQTRYGHFEGTFTAADPGTYVVRAGYQWNESGQPHSGFVQAGLNVAFEAEWRDIHSNENYLAQIAEATGGRILRDDLPQAVYEAASIRPVQTHRPVWDRILQIALVVFLLDVAIRRLAINPVETVHRIRAYIDSLVIQRTPDAAPATLSTLRGVRQRVRQKPKAVEPEPTESVLGDKASSTESAEPAVRSTERLRKTKPKRREGEPLTLMDVPEQPPAQPAPQQEEQKPEEDAEAEDASPTARLLRAKRRARKKE